MRVLQLITRRQRRGAEVFASDLADVLVLRGYEVLVAGLYDAASPPLIPARAGWIDLDARADRRLSATTLAAVMGLIRRFQPDLVQANGADTLKYSALAKAVTRGTWPLVYRNIGVASQWLRHRPHRAWSRWLVGFVDHVAAVSDACRDDFLRTYHLEDRRVTTIPNAIRITEPPSTTEARRRLAELAGIPEGADLLVHVGSFAPEKNHLWLLDAFDRIRQLRPDARLVLLGDGPLRARVTDAVAARGLGDRVHLLGGRIDADVLVGGADVLVLPSLVEGIPGVVLEAAAQSVPTVATDVGGMREVVHDGDTGMLVRSGDLDAFVACTVDLLGDPARLRRMGAAARALVRQRFDIATVSREYESLYRRLGRGADSPGHLGRTKDRVVSA